MYFNFNYLNICINNILYKNFYLSLATHKMNIKK
nr:MAG TPA: hypothetical protein [Caudoviricetes sp.]